MDPRVKTPAADWQKRFELQGRLASVMTRSSRTIRHAHSLLEQIETLAKEPRAPGPELAALKAKLLALLDAPAGATGAEAESALTGIHGEAGELYNSLDPADAAPTKAQVAVAAELAEEFNEAAERWEKLLTGDMATLNRRLKTAGLPELKPNTLPNAPDEVEEADID
jgi:hypothetical protein